jgi:L-threonylcarbamoyladenylate synthase
MEIIGNPTQVEIKKAARALMDGHLVAFPTETVYGLGADARNIDAVRQIYKIKGRPSNHPLIIHISSIQQLDHLTIEIPEYARKLALDFWPGPLTLILKRSNLINDQVTGGQNTVGIRMPAHPIALGLLSNFEKIGGIGVAAPSANKFGAVSPTTVSAVLDEIGAELRPNDIIIDGGQCSLGIESTILNCTENLPIILRPGIVTTELIQNSIGNKLRNKTNSEKIHFSGSFRYHYSPRAVVVIGHSAGVGDGFIAMSDIKTPRGAIRLGAPDSIENYARDLYLFLRLADKLKVKKIFVSPPKGSGIALAVSDRIFKAAGQKNL